MRDVKDGKRRKIHLLLCAELYRLLHGMPLRAASVVLLAFLALCLPLSALRQYDLLDSYSRCDGVEAEVVLWLIDRDLVLLAPIGSIRRLKADGRKSISAKDYASYGIREVPSRKLRVFMESDYRGVM